MYRPRLCTSCLPFTLGGRLPKVDNQSGTLLFVSFSIFIEIQKFRDTNRKWVRSDQIPEIEGLRVIPHEMVLQHLTYGINTPDKPPLTVTVMVVLMISTTESILATTRKSIFFVAYLQCCRPSVWAKEIRLSRCHEKARRTGERIQLHHGWKREKVERLSSYLMTSRNIRIFQP